MISIWLAVGSSILCAVIALVVSYFLPKEKIRTANQSLLEEEQKQQLRIKELENAYLQKEKELTTQTNELQIEQQNIITQIQQEKDSWEKEKTQDILNLTNQTKELEVEVRGLEERRNNIIQTLEQEAKKSGEIFKEQQIQIAEEQVESAKKEMEAEYITAAEDAKQNYLNILADLLADVNEQYGISSQKLEETLQKLAEAQAKAAAAIEVNRRAELEKSEKDFYRLQLSETDLEEIERLRSVIPYLRDKEPLNKVIYKCYYEKPYTDLVGRVFNGRKPSGIYKITNLQNGKCYVGQATNIPERWRQHIKRGVGADVPTQNKLYPAMLEIGVENFMFEVVEECKAIDLTPREKYWTDFYGAQTYGYVVKKG